MVEPDPARYQLQYPDSQNKRNQLNPAELAIQAEPVTMKYKDADDGLQQVIAASLQILFYAHPGIGAISP